MPIQQAAPAGAATETCVLPSDKKRRSFRVVRRNEVPQEYEGYRLWRSVAMAIEAALETVSMKQTVQRRVWMLMLVICKEHGAPALWGRPIALSRHTAALLAKLGMTEANLRTVLKKAQLVGLLDLIPEERRRKRGSPEWEPFHFHFGLSIRTALKKIFAYLLRRTKSPEYKGKFSNDSGSREYLFTIKEREKLPTIHSGYIGSKDRQERVFEAPNLADFGPELGAAVGRLQSGVKKEVIGKPEPVVVVEPPQKPLVVVVEPPMTPIVAIQAVVGVLSSDAAAIFRRKPLEPRSTPAPAPSSTPTPTPPPVPRPLPSHSSSALRRQWWRIIDEPATDISAHLDELLARPSVRAKPDTD